MMVFPDNILLMLFINSMLIFGVYKLTDYEEEEIEKDGFKSTRITDKMLFWYVRYWCVRRIGEKWSKPICTCQPCMSSLWSFPVFWLMMPINLHSLLFFPFYVVSLCSINAFLMKHFD
jgi:hypothetical protein